MNILDIVLPRFCLLCSASLLGLPDPKPWPLCPLCLSKLAIDPGPRCLRCGQLLISEEGICFRCRNTESAVDSAFSLYAYDHIVRELLSLYKKGRRRSLAALFADLMENQLILHYPESVIVPVPPRPGSQRRKGWDHIEEIAAILESKGFPLARVLCRRAAGEQKRLGKSGRLANARLAFHLKSKGSAPRNSVIIDDVITTGATSQACAAALKAGGAQVVNFMAIASD